MKHSEMIEVVSSASGIEKGPTRKVLDALVATLKQQMEKEEKVKLQGLGIFIRRTGKKDGKTRIVFKPSVPKEERTADVDE